MLEALVGTDKSVKDIKAIYNALGEEARGQVDAAAQHGTAGKGSSAGHYEGSRTASRYRKS